MAASLCRAWRFVMNSCHRFIITPRYSHDIHIKADWQLGSRVPVTGTDDCDRYRMTIIVISSQCIRADTSKTTHTFVTYWTLNQLLYAFEMLHSRLYSVARNLHAFSTNLALFFSLHFTLSPLAQMHPLERINYPF
jgi:hypothetical protein